MGIVPNPLSVIFSIYNDTHFNGIIKRMKSFKILLISLVLTSCSTGTLSLKSTPDKAQVKVVDPDGEIRSLGETPVSIPLNQVFQNGAYVQLIVESSGHNPEKVLLTKPQIETSYNLSFKLNKETQDLDAMKTIDNLERIAVEIANAQRLMYAKRSEEAETILKRVVDEFPAVSVGYDMLGNIYYMKNDYRQALKYYETALELNPTNLERKRVVEKIKGMTRSTGREE
jgi:tetratricopeptide (TPR) repeat protein